MVRLVCTDMSRSACLDSLCPELLSNLAASLYRPAGQNYTRPCRRQGFHCLNAQPTIASSHQGCLACHVYSHLTQLLDSGHPRPGGCHNLHISYPLTPQFTSSMDALPSIMGQAERAASKNSSFLLEEKSREWPGSKHRPTGMKLMYHRLPTRVGLTC